MVIYNIFLYIISKFNGTWRKRTVVVQRGRHATTGNIRPVTDTHVRSRTILTRTVLFSSRQSVRAPNSKIKKKKDTFSLSGYKSRCVLYKGSARSLVLTCVSVTTILRNVSLSFVVEEENNLPGASRKYTDIRRAHPSHARYTIRMKRV